MPYRRISDDVKERALWLLDHDYIPDEVAYLLGVSDRSIARWRANQEQFGSPNRPVNYARGRPRTLDAQQTEDLIALTVEAPEMLLDEIQQWLIVAHGVGLSVSRIHEILRDCGITYKMLRRAAAEVDQEAKIEWRVINQQNLHARQCVWMDESSKDNRTIYRHFGRAVRGIRAAVSHSFDRGQRYSLIGALTLDGYMAARAVPGSVDSIEFLTFVIEEVLPQMNPFPEDRSVLILDNCVIHKTDALRTIVEGAGCKLLFLPAYCPDLNPIENSFSAIKAWIRRHYQDALDADNAVEFLLDATSAVNPENAMAWIKDCGYIVD